MKQLPPPTAQMHWHASALATLLTNIYLFTYYQNLWRISLIPELFK
jgi:hypothetical protein